MMIHFKKMALGILRIMQFTSTWHVRAMQSVSMHTSTTHKMDHPRFGKYLFNKFYKRISYRIWSYKKKVADLMGLLVTEDFTKTEDCISGKILIAFFLYRKYS